MRIIALLQQLSIMLSLAVLASALPGVAEPVHGLFTEELDRPLYNCALTLAPAATGVLTVRLEDDGKGHGLRLTVSAKGMTLFTVAGARVATVPIDAAPGVVYACVVLRRDTWIALAHEDVLLFRGEAPRGSGNRGEIIPGKGWSVNEVRVQPLEPVVFADNFMRTKDESGAWTIVSGQWGLQSAWDNDPRGGNDRFINATYAQNPFAWIGHSGDAPGWCLAGQPFWEDYTFTTAVKPPEDGAVGVGVNMDGTRSGVLVRWTSAADHGPRGDRLCLLTLADGKETELAQDRGGYLPGQWYQLQVVSGLAGVRVLVDGRERLAVDNIMPWHGEVGLYVEGSHPATFDDVTVYGRTLRTDLINEHQQARFNDRFQHDVKGMASWAATTSEWRAFPGAPEGFLLHRWPYFGDARLSLTLRPQTGNTGECCLLLNGDGISPTAGYRAIIGRDAAGKTIYALLRDTHTLADSTGKALTAGDDYGVRFQRAGNHLRLEIDGAPVLEAVDPQPLTGNHVAYHVSGCFADAKEVVALGRNVRDYSFDDAPVDWRAEGTWMPTTRWSCTPHWSYLGGWSRGDAVLWHKHSFTGDQSLEAFMAMKMEYPRERQVSADRFRDFCITICGDGHNPRTGYTGIYGAPDRQGTANRRTVLLRDGVEVAAIDQPAPDYKTGGHTAWFDLTLHKRGAVVEFWTQGRLALSYTDPHPIEAGTPAIWTADNGIALARARLAFANPPGTPTDPRVLLDEPWYPEWADVGAPLTLAFPRACSTTGKPVQLHVTPRAVPAGGAEMVTTAGNRITFTPRAVGDYWYQVAAAEGGHASPAFNLALRTFDTKRGRDDSHAVVLYRFTEGLGQTVRDVSKAGLGVDVTFPADAPARWLPGQGLQLTGPCALTSGRAVAKLTTALKRARACTIEFWVSFDTIFPPVDWTGCLLAWQQDNAHRNLAIANFNTNVMVTRAPTFTPRHGDAALFNGLRTGLQHIVLTWDGTTACCYRNGELLGRDTLPWQLDRWSEDAPLVLGNVPANPRSDNAVTTRFLGIASYIFSEERGKDYSFLGAYYLVAIHDRCFTPADVQRHYEVGPSAPDR